MKIIKNTIIVSVVLALLGFAFFFSPSKPLSLVKDINLVDINAKAGSSEKSEYFDGSLYYLSSSDEYGQELWRASDGKAEIVKDLNPGVGYITLDRIIKENSHIYFIINNSSSKEIYTIAKGSKELTKISPDNLLNIQSFKTVDEKTFFIVNKVDSGDEVYRLSNGSLVQETDGSEYNFVNLFSYVFYNGSIYLYGNFDGVHKVVEYKNGVNTSIYDGGYVAKLIGNDQVLYLVINNGGDKDFYKFNGSTFSLAGKLGGVWERDIVVYGDFIAAYGVNASGSTDKQLHISNGSDFTQITNFDDTNFYHLSYLALAGDTLYYHTKTGSPTELKLYQLEQNIVTEIPIDIDGIEGSLGQDTSVYANNSKVVFWGQGDDSQYSVYVLEGAVATKVFTPNSSLERRPKYFEDNLYYLDNTSFDSFEIIKLNLETSTISTISELSVRAASLLSVDEKIFIGYGSDYHRTQLGEVIGSVITPYLKNDTTGSSVPYNFVEANGVTYFLADDGINGREVWVSNGYDAELILETLEGEGNISYKLSKLGDSVLVFPKANNAGKVSLIKNEVVEEIGEVTYISGDFTRVGGSVFFVGEFMGDYTRDLGIINEDGLSKVARRVFSQLYGVGSGVIYSEYGSSTGEYLYTDGVNTKALETDGVEIASIERVIGSSIGNYYLVVRKAESFEKSILHFSEELGLQELNYDFSKYIDITDFVSNKDIVVRLREGHHSSEIKFVNLNGLTAEEIDFSELAGNPRVIYRTDNRLYFEMTDNELFKKSYYFYQDNEFTKIDWNLAGNLKIANRDVNNGVEWVVSYNATDGSHYLLSNDGTDVEYVGKIQTESPLLELVEAAQGVFLRFGERIENSELAYITEDGTVSFLSDGKDFHWNGYNSSYEPFMSKGHGKWFFMRGCTATYGCEPFSMNLNQFPTAKYSSETSYYSGQKVTLNASSTEDPDGDILEYNWTQLSGPGINFESIEGENITFKAPKVDAAQDVVIELTVVDDGYDKDITSKSIRINPNQKPSVSINAPASASEGDTVTLDASGSADPEGGELSFVWSVEVGQNITIQKKTESVANFVVPSLSEDVSVELKLTVTDEEGNESFKMVGMELKNKASGGGNNDDSANGGSGGGGSTSWLLLMMLGLILIHRRVK